VVGERGRERRALVWARWGECRKEKGKGKERVWLGWKRETKEWDREMAWPGMAFLFLFFQKQGCHSDEGVQYKIACHAR